MLTYADRKRPHADLKRLYTDRKRLYADRKRLFADRKRLFADEKCLFANRKRLFADRNVHLIPFRGSGGPLSTAVIVPPSPTTSVLERGVRAGEGGKG